MYWNYRVMRIPSETSDSYGIHEVYYGPDDKPVYYSSEPVPCYAWSEESLGAEVERFKTALSKPILSPEDFPKNSDPDSTQEMTYDPHFLRGEEKKEV